MDVDLTPLIAELGNNTVVTDGARTDKYRRDRANDPQAGFPCAVVRAGSTQDVQAALRFASAHRVAVVPRGAGSGLSGGASALEGCIVISTERMSDIVIDPLARVAKVGAGALNVAVKKAAAEHDLWYPPDPSSYELCSIGGNVATNAGGLCCVKYGVTSDYVLGMTVVLSDGTAARLGGPRLKDAAGLSLTKLFVGSEGTLGIITRVYLRLLPRQHPPSTLVATFSSLGDATATVLAITSRLRPSMLEFMDRTTINAVEDLSSMGLDREAAAMLVIQCDEPAGQAAEECADISALCSQHRATDIFVTDDVLEGEAFLAARRRAIPALERTGALLLEDVGVPLGSLGTLVEGIADISARSSVTIAVIAHAGDGNTHPLIVFDPTDGASEVRAREAYGEVMDLALKLGGTITGEHGVGRLKRPWLEAYLGADVLAINRRIKEALDPEGILNPGSGI